MVIQILEKFVVYILLYNVRRLYIFYSIFLVKFPKIVMRFLFYFCLFSNFVSRFKEHTFVSCKDPSLNNRRLLVSELVEQDDNEQNYYTASELFQKKMQFLFSNRSFDQTNKIRAEVIMKLNNIIKNGVNKLHSQSTSENEYAFCEHLSEYIHSVENFIVSDFLKSFIASRIADILNEQLALDITEKVKFEEAPGDILTMNDVQKKLNNLYLSLNEYSNTTKLFQECDYIEILTAHMREKNPSSKIDFHPDRFRLHTISLFYFGIRDFMKELRGMEKLKKMEDYYKNQNIKIFEHFLYLVCLEILLNKALNYSELERIFPIEYFEPFRQLFSEYTRFVLKEIYALQVFYREKSKKKKLSSVDEAVNKPNISIFLHEKIKNTIMLFLYVLFDNYFIDSSIFSLFFIEDNVKSSSIIIEFNKLKLQKNATLQQLKNILSKKNLTLEVFFNPKVFKEFLGYFSDKDRKYFYDNHYENALKFENSINLGYILKKDYILNYNNEIYFYFIIRISILSSYMSIHKFYFHLNNIENVNHINDDRSQIIEKLRISDDKNNQRELLCKIYYILALNMEFSINLDYYKDNYEKLASNFTKNTQNLTFGGCVLEYSLEYFINFMYFDFPINLLFDQKQQNQCFDKSFHFLYSDVYAKHYNILSKKYNIPLSKWKESDVIFRRGSNYYLGKEEVESGEKNTKDLKTNKMQHRLQIHEISYIFSYNFPKISHIQIYDLNSNVKAETIIGFYLEIFNSNLVSGYDKIEKMRRFLLIREDMEYILMVINQYENGKHKHLFMDKYKHFLLNKKFFDFIECNDGDELINSFADFNKVGTDSIKVWDVKIKRITDRIMDFYKLDDTGIIHTLNDLNDLINEFINTLKKYQSFFKEKIKKIPSLLVNLSDKSEKFEPIIENFCRLKIRPLKIFKSKIEIYYQLKNTEIINCADRMGKNLNCRDIELEKFINEIDKIKKKVYGEIRIFLLKSEKIDEKFIKQLNEFYNKSHEKISSEISFGFKEKKKFYSENKGYFKDFLTKETNKHTSILDIDLMKNMLSIKTNLLCYDQNKVTDEKMLSLFLNLFSNHLDEFEQVFSQVMEEDKET